MTTINVSDRASLPEDDRSSGQAGGWTYMRTAKLIIDTKSAS
jgi:hypothetical protein